MCITVGATERLDGVTIFTSFQRLKQRPVDFGQKTIKKPSRYKAYVTSAGQSILIFGKRRFLCSDTLLPSLMHCTILVLRLALFAAVRSRQRGSPVLSSP